MQILIFRLELDPTIKCIPCVVLQLNNVPNLPNFFLHELNWETSKNEGLADDNSSLILLEVASLQSIKTALRDFGLISGLKCNYEKSVIMPFNVTSPETILEIERLGFSVVDKFKLLGVEIKQSLDNEAEIFSEIVEKIRSLALFWERFKLSLPGRLNIIKTCLVSQINYIGCFLPIPDPALSTLQCIIDGFVKKKLSVSAEQHQLN